MYRLIFIHFLIYLGVLLWFSPPYLSHYQANETHFLVTNQPETPQPCQISQEDSSFPLEAILRVQSGISASYAPISPFFHLVRSYPYPRLLSFHFTQKKYPHQAFSTLFIFRLYLRNQVLRI
jgi:hypothetical protein